MSARRTLVALALLALLLPACSRGGDDRLTIYSSRARSVLDPLLQRYMEQTGRRIDVHYGESADLAERIEEEGDDSPADLFLSQSPGALDRLSTKAVLAELPAGVLDLVDARFRSEAGEWVGLSGHRRVLLYSTGDVTDAELPAAVLDLTAPNYADRVAVAPTSASFQDFVTAMRQSIGDDQTLAWLTALEANGAKTYSDSAAIAPAVGRGDVDLGLVNHPDDELAKVENPKMATADHLLEAGDLGNLVLVSGIGLLRSSDHQDEARQLVNFLLGPQAQTYFADEALEYPLAGGASPAAALAPLDSIGAPAVDLSSLGDLETTVRLIEASGLAGD